jgi:inner membrane protein
VTSLVASLGAWNWFIVGVLLLVAEVIAPGIFMLWLGLAALLVGMVSLFVDWTWQWQCAAFVVFAAAAFPLWRRLGRKAERPTDQPFLNRRADAFVGRVFTLEKPIVDGSGTLGIGDTVWRVSGPDIPAGSRVKIARTDGPLLIVERAES